MFARVGTREGFSSCPRRQCIRSSRFSREDFLVPITLCLLEACSLQSRIWKGEKNHFSHLHIRHTDTYSREAQRKVLSYPQRKKVFCSSESHFWGKHTLLPPPTERDREREKVLGADATWLSLASGAGRRQDHACMSSFYLWLGIELYLFFLSWE